MDPNKIALQLVTRAATTTCPRILAETARASHGPRHERAQHLQQAIAHASDLLDKLQAVAADVDQAARTEELETA